MEEYQAYEWAVAAMTRELAEEISGRYDAMEMDELLMKLDAISEVRTTAKYRRMRYEENQREEAQQ